MATTTKIATTNKMAKTSTGKTTGSKPNKAKNISELIKTEVKASEQAPASVLAISAAETPFVELPQAITLTKAALQKSVGALSEAWDYEQEHHLGLELLRLVGRTIRDIGSPLLLLLIYGGAVVAEKASADDAKQIRSERWQRLLSACSRRTGTLDKNELEIADEATTSEGNTEVVA